MELDPSIGSFKVYQEFLQPNGNGFDRQRSNVQIEEVDFSTNASARTHFPYLSGNIRGIFRVSDMKELEVSYNINDFRLFSLEFIPCVDPNDTKCASREEIDNYLS